MQSKFHFPVKPFVVFLILSVSLSASAQKEIDKQIDQIFSAWNSPGKPGAAVSVVKNGEIIFSKGYGLANLEYDIPVTPATVFHIASISKQVTAFAILLLERDGKLSLDDDIRKYIPEVPDFGKTITLRQLALHNSGLRDQWTLLTMAGWRMDDVITTEHILKLVSHQKSLNFNPGDAHLYCNTGYTLLAEVVARISGQSFSEFTRKNIFAPLKMNNTIFYDDHEKIVKNRAYSYNTDGSEGFKKSNLNYATVGATSLFTTVEDLSLWAMNLDKPIVGDAAMIEKMNQRGILNNGDTLNYALGQSFGIYKGNSFIAHGGADAGYRSFLIRFPKSGLDVAVLSNYAMFDPAGMAFKVSELFLNVPESEKIPEIKSQAQVDFKADPVLLAAYCGKYELQPGLVVTLSAEGEQLFVEAPQLPKSQLKQMSATEFTLPAMNAQIKFVCEEKKDPVMFVELNGAKMSGKRLLEFDREKIELSEYAGDYYSPELSTTYTFKVQNGKLIAMHPRISNFDLTMLNPDKFSADLWFFSKIEFIRNDRNIVSGCLVSSDRVKNLIFEKVK